MIKKRTEDLGYYGIRVIRYTNCDVSEGLDGVSDDLLCEIRKRMKELGIEKHLEY